MKTIVLSAAIAACAATFATAQHAPNPGAYLAGQSAISQSDFDEAAYWFTRALQDDPANPMLIETTLASMVGAGDMTGAVSVAKAAEPGVARSQFVNLLLDADAARRGDWDAILAAHEAGRSVSPLVDGITRGWAHLGGGDVDRALAAFDEVIETPWMKPIGLYHKAIALASVGDYDGAVAILTTPPPEGPQVTRRAAIALAQAQSQLGRNAQAAAMLSDLFGPDPDLAMTALRDTLVEGRQVPFNLVTSPAEGMAELYLTVAGVLGDETPPSYVLFHSRLGQWLKPREAELALLSAGILEDLGNLELASAAYASIPQDDPAFYDAEIGRADLLRRADDTRLAIEVLQNLARAFPDKPLAHIALGNTLRQDSRFDAARDSYDDAIDTLAADDPRLWFVHYMRAVSSHRHGDWPAAEADFRQALEYNPGQPQVLNYLGYSLVERGEKLEEALDMIERAIAREPDNGAIVDSLGWGLFVLGRVEEAVGPMERAAELEPMDPIVNDHLGDVYWTVGRYREARFQWTRALSLDPDPELAESIRHKLDNGLDTASAQADDRHDVSVVRDE